MGTVVTVRRAETGLIVTVVGPVDGSDVTLCAAIGDLGDQSRSGGAQSDVEVVDPDDLIFATIKTSAGSSEEGDEESSSEDDSGKTFDVW